MRILHVTPTYLPARRYGGPIVAVHGLCKALAARGHDVMVFTTNVDGDGESDVPLDRAVELDGVQVRYFRSSFRRLYWSVGMRDALRAEIASFDLVHLHAVFLWPAAAAGRIAHHAGVPYVLSPRGMLVRELIRRKSRFVKTAWLQLIERRTLANAAGIHFTSERERHDAEELGLPLPNPLVVPNGIDLLPRPAVPRDERTVVYLGRINWKKALDRLIAALPRDARLIIAGNDEENLTPKLRELARGRDVEFPGAVYGDAKWELLARATLFALPSISENFGNAVVEAMMMETPVVISPEVGVGIDGAGLVASDFSAAIDTLLGDEALRRTMGRAGRALAESQFAWPVVAAEMEQAYFRARTTKE